jgi:hypothetical protein
VPAGFPAHHRSIAPSRNPSFEERERYISVLKLRHFQLVASLTARCRALFSARPRRLASDLAIARSLHCPSHMTNEEVEDVVRALTAVVENLKASGAKQSMQEAFVQVLAYAGERRPELRLNPDCSD